MATRSSPTVDRNIDGRSELARRHSLVAAAGFRVRCLGLQVRRLVLDARSGVGRRGTDSGRVGSEAPVVAESRSPLRPDSDGNGRALTDGKVHNLRVAARRLDGTEVAAGEVLSFWHQVGPPWRARGYVPGREIREGCIVPAVGGGLCQLSNALHEVALDAGLEIVERHGHSRIVPGSRASAGRDATVKWNHIDLRLRSASAFRVEVTAEAGDLVVRLRSRDAPARRPRILVPLLQPALRAQADTCESCGNEACRLQGRHADPASPEPTTVVVLDETWPEHEAVIAQYPGPSTATVLVRAWHSRSPGPAPPPGTRVTTVRAAATLRSAAVRAQHRRGHPIAATRLAADRIVARRVARAVPSSCRTLVVSQNLAPELWRLGAFWGRDVVVLMTRLPARVLHARLDDALALHPHSSTLGDFRAPPAWVAGEDAALAAAHRLVTPHLDIAAAAPASQAVDLVPWVRPDAAATVRRPGPALMFAGAGYERHGASVARDTAIALGRPVRLARPGVESAATWSGVDTELQPAGSFDGVSVVMAPAVVAIEPRLLLAALDAGIPVVATPACGLPPQPGLTLVPMGDAATFRDAVAATLVGHESTAAGPGR